MQPDNDWIRRKYAEVLAKGGRKSLARAWRMAPEVPDIRRRYVAHLAGKGTKNALIEALSIDPENRQIRCAYAYMLLSEGTTESVMKAFQVFPYFKAKQPATDISAETKLIARLVYWLNSCRGEQGGRELENTIAKILQSGVSGQARRTLRQAQQLAYVATNEPDRAANSGCLVVIGCVVLGIGLDFASDVSSWLIWIPIVIAGLIARAGLASYYDLGRLNARRRSFRMALERQEQFRQHSIPDPNQTSEANGPERGDAAPPSG